MKNIYLLVLSLFFWRNGIKKLFISIGFPSVLLFVNFFLKKKKYERKKHCESHNSEINAHGFCLYHIPFNRVIPNHFPNAFHHGDLYASIKLTKTHIHRTIYKNQTQKWQTLVAFTLKLRVVFFFPYQFYMTLNIYTVYTGCDE